MDQDWRTQLDFFFEDPHHVNCDQRHRILRILMEDVAPLSHYVGACEHQTWTVLQELQRSLYTMRGMVMMEASQMYNHYFSKYPGDGYRAQAVYNSWRSKHSEYDYLDTSDRLNAKRSLVSLFYQLEVEAPEDCDCREDKLSSDVIDNEEDSVAHSISSPRCQTSPVASDYVDEKDTFPDDESRFFGLAHQPHHHTDCLPPTGMCK